MNKVTEERNSLKRELDTKNHDIQEKLRTITQVKKIGRRYKTQYDELKVDHDKVRSPDAAVFNPTLNISCYHLSCDCVTESKPFFYVFPSDGR